MVKLPLVSIIIPSYNSYKWVCDAIDSSLNQVYPNYEVIVVDDGSTDNTKSLLMEKYGERINYIYQENRGSGGARNTGIEHAKGEYIQFLDADDILLPEKLAVHVQCLEENPEYSISYSDYEYFWDGQPEIRESSPPAFRDKYSSGDLLEKLLTGNFIVCHAVLARRKEIIAAGRFDEALAACEDYDLWVRMAYRGNKFYFTDKVLALYRKRPGSRSHNHINNIKSTIRVLKRLRFASFHKKREKYLLRSYLSKLHDEAAREFLKTKNILPGLKHYVAAVKYMPSDAKVLTKNAITAYNQGYGRQ